MWVRCRKARSFELHCLGAFCQAPTLACLPRINSCQGTQRRCNQALDALSLATRCVHHLRGTPIQHLLLGNPPTLRTLAAIWHLLVGMCACVGCVAGRCHELMSALLWRMCVQAAMQPAQHPAAQDPAFTPPHACDSCSSWPRSWSCAATATAALQRQHQTTTPHSLIKPCGRR